MAEARFYHHDFVDFYDHLDLFNFIHFLAALYKRGVVKKRSFYGQVDRKGGGGPFLTVKSTC